MRDDKRRPGELADAYAMGQALAMLIIIIALVAFLLWMWLVP